MLIPILYSPIVCVSVLIVWAPSTPTSFQEALASLTTAFGVLVLLNINSPDEIESFTAILNVHVLPPLVNPVLIMNVPLSLFSLNPVSLISWPAIKPPVITFPFVTPDFHWIVIVLVELNINFSICDVIVTNELENIQPREPLLPTDSPLSNISPVKGAPAPPYETTCDIS